MFNQDIFSKAHFHIRGRIRFKQWAEQLMGNILDAAAAGNDDL